MEPKTWLHLSNKLWVADLHDIDRESRGEAKLISLKTTPKQHLVLTQDVVYANSYRRRSPMVTMSLCEEGYLPNIHDLSYVFNDRACYHYGYTIFAGSYWENAVENQDVLDFYDKFLKNDPAVAEHRNFNNQCSDKDKEEAKKPEGADKEVDDVSDASVWSWRQSRSSFPFLLFTTCKPVLKLMSLQDREDVDCIVVWNVMMSNTLVGKAYFLPYGIPDMVGEAGIAVLRDQQQNLKGLVMSEKVRDTFIKEDRALYRYAQENCIPDLHEYQTVDPMTQQQHIAGQNYSSMIPQDNFADQIDGDCIDPSQYVNGPGNVSDVKVYTVPDIGAEVEDHYGIPQMETQIGDYFVEGNHKDDGVMLAEIEAALDEVYGITEAQREMEEVYGMPEELEALNYFCDVSGMEGMLGEANLAYQHDGLLEESHDVETVYGPYMRDEDDDENDIPEEIFNALDDVYGINNTKEDSDEDCIIEAEYESREKAIEEMNVFAAPFIGKSIELDDNSAHSEQLAVPLEFHGGVKSELSCAEEKVVFTPASEDSESFGSFSDIDELAEEFTSFNLTDNGDILGPNEYEPPLVMFARTGNKSAVEKLLIASGASHVMVNVSQKWTETQVKWGHKKTWDWHDDTALIAATRQGYYHVVKYLLLMKADPTLESCHYRDIYESASEVAEYMWNKGKCRLDEVTSVPRQLQKEGERRALRDVAVEILDDITDAENILAILELSLRYWKKAAYSSSHYSNERQRRMMQNPNLPTNEDELMSKLSKFVSKSTSLKYLEQIIESIEKLNPNLSRKPQKHRKNDKTGDDKDTRCEEKTRETKQIELKKKEKSVDNSLPEKATTKKDPTCGSEKEDELKTGSDSNSKKNLDDKQGPKEERSKKIAREERTAGDDKLPKVKKSKSRGREERYCINSNCINKSALHCRNYKCGDCCPGCRYHR